MTNDDKQAAVPASPQESLPELEEQALVNITGGGSRGVDLPKGYDPFRSWSKATSKPDLGRLATTSTSVLDGAVIESQKDTIKDFDSEQKTTLKPLNTPKSIAERRQIVNDFRELPFHS